MKYDTMVMIGRFQPVHKGHLMVIQEAVKQTRELIIIVGSADKPRSYKNPWTAKERASMLNSALNGMDIGACRIHIEQITDSLYNDTAWATRVQGIVSKYRCLGGRTGIIGHKKDESSFYLDMFPQWDTVLLDKFLDIDATKIREQFFSNGILNSSELPYSTIDFLQNTRISPEYEAIVAEKKYLDKYKLQFESMAYPPIFVTVDAVVVCAGHILLIKRKSYPGKGLWALPGGFVNANTDRSIPLAMRRELKEETGLTLPPIAIQKAEQEVFDAIGRSERGRTITHAFYINFGKVPLPKVKGMDDAEKAIWLPLNELKSDQMFEDHYEIINTMLAMQ